MMLPAIKTAVFCVLGAAGAGAVLLFTVSGPSNPARLLIASAFATQSPLFDRETPEEVIVVEPQTVHLKTPEPMYAIYMTQCAVGTPSLRNSLVEFIDNTQLNAVIIDIKDYSGRISFSSENPALADSTSPACGARDMKEFIEKLHDKGIYVIGRITVFQDPFYSKTHP